MANQVWSLLLVTSTTRVLPSQCPRESPIQSLMSDPTCGRVERDHAVAVVIVVGHHHGAGNCWSWNAPDS
jgi:hypothetical protein